jgi:hypothetical protein
MQDCGVQVMGRRWGSARWYNVNYELDFSPPAGAPEMFELSEILFLVASVLVPIFAFSRAARQPSPTVGKLLTSSTVAGLAVGVSFLMVNVVTNLRMLFNWALYPWVLYFAFIGAAIGTAGVLARLVGRIWGARV